MKLTPGNFPPEMISNSCITMFLMVPGGESVAVTFTACHGTAGSAPSIETDSSPETISDTSTLVVTKKLTAQLKTATALNPNTDSESNPLIWKHSPDRTAVILVVFVCSFAPTLLTFVT